MNNQTNSISLNEILHAPRDPNSLNLVNEIHQYLIDAGLIKQADFFINDLNIIGIKDKINIIQRYVLNRFFTIQIYNVEINNVAVNGYGERYVLMPDGTDSEWLSMFRRRVVPFLITHNLPKAI